MKLSGKVTRVKDYGCFVSFDDSKLSAMCHVSEVTDKFVKVGALASAPLAHVRYRTSTSSSRRATP